MPSRSLALLVVLLCLGGSTGCPQPSRTVKKPRDTTPGQTPPAPPRAPEVTPQSPSAAPETTRSNLAQARGLLAALRDRPLSGEQRSQVDSGEAFIEQADAALRDGDQDRAATLADKALALLQQIDKDTRPA